MGSKIGMALFNNQPLKRLTFFYFVTQVEIFVNPCKIKLDLYSMEIKAFINNDLTGVILDV